MNPIPPATQGEVSDPGGSDSNPAAAPMSQPSQSEASAALENGHEQLPKRLPSLRSISDPASMNPSSHPLRNLSNARRPAASSFTGGAFCGSDAMSKARSLAQSRKGMSPVAKGPDSGGPNGGFPNLRLPHGAGRPGLPGSSVSSSAIPRPPQGLSARRGMNLNMNNMAPSPPQTQAAGSTTSNGSSGSMSTNPTQTNGVANPSKMDDFKKYIDTERGWLTFEGAATITDKGVNFSNGKSFSMSLDEVELLEELGKGNYGTVFKVRHAKPSRPRFGTGLSQTRRPSPSPSPTPSMSSVSSSAPDWSDTASNGSASTTTTRTGAGAAGSGGTGGGTGVIMAMKEIRLELDEAKFTTILKELVILHECVSPYIIDFYGAFFQEGAVYMCIEYMDGGSIDKLYAGGVPEEVLRRITHATIMGLRSLKDEHNIIHRDVKPTNVLVNTRGQVKICDFGVSGNLVSSIAKTNIGCQSYMAPERISGTGEPNAAGGRPNGTYSVQSDIWSLGLTIIECAMGKYPYPPEASANIFDQLQAIVHGEAPDLPAEGYSQNSRDFVRSCLNKIPNARPTYDMLLKTPWMKSLSDACATIPEEPEEEEKHDTEEGSDDEDDVKATTNGVQKLAVAEAEPGVHDAVVAEWVRGALERRAREGNGEGMRPALHAAPLDQVSPGLAASAGMQM